MYELTRTKSPVLNAPLSTPAAAITITATRPPVMSSVCPKLRKASEYEVFNAAST